MDSQDRWIMQDSKIDSYFRAIAKEIGWDGIERGGGQFINHKEWIKSMHTPPGLGICVLKNIRKGFY